MDIVDVLTKVKKEFSKHNELLKDLDPNKAVEVMINLSELCQCDSWDDALAYRFLIYDPDKKKQLEILAQIYYMKLSNKFLTRLPQIDEIFKQTVKIWQELKKSNELKP